MKKILLTAFAIMLLCGCSTDDLPKNSATPVTSPSIDEQYKKIEKTNNTNYEALNKYRDCYYDFDHDDVEEAVTLYTSAQKASDGEFMWDDSQNWVLTVEGNNGSYVLSNEHIHGKQELFVGEKYEKDGNVSASIRLVISASSGFEIKEYTYKDGNFYENTVYDAGALNELSVNQY